MNYENFLKDYRIKKEEKGTIKPTHTRIGNQTLNIYGGSFHIPPEKLKEFHKLYYEHVIKGKASEYLTEVQNKELGSSILLDFDFAFPKTVKKRVLTDDHIEDLIEVYSEQIRKLFKIPEDMTFKVYVFQKDKVNRLKEKTKDGIHMIFGLHTDHNAQLILRNMVVRDLKENIIFDSSLEIQNSMENICDIAVPRGGNWQMYGSKKPGCDKYKLKKIFNVSFDEDVVEKEEIKNFKISKHFKAISAHNYKFAKLEINENYKQEYDNFVVNQQRKPSTNVPQNLSISKINLNLNIKTEAELDEQIKRLLSNLSPSEYFLKTTHELTMNLPSKFYDNYDDWIRVGWALHNTHKLLFLTWIKFSSLSDKFSFNDVGERLMEWNKMSDNGYTYRSIMFWCSRSNKDAYNQIIKNSSMKLIEKCFDGPGCDRDLANLVFHFYRLNYSCASIDKKQWFVFKNHRWRKIEAGTTLRKSISDEIEKIFADKASDLLIQLQNVDNQEQEKAILAKISASNTITKKLKSRKGLDDIMSESRHRFYDEHLIDKMDENHYLMGFKNGVFDFKENRFRDGMPGDYISNSTRLKYVSYNPKNKKHQEKKEFIDDFMSKLFPHEKLRKYVWEFTASCLIGGNTNQTFNIFIGAGENGKSVYVDFIQELFGDYGNTLSVSYITQKRGQSSAASPEIMKLKGSRFVVMGEPSKGDVVNEGKLKEISGCDKMSGRMLHQNETTFTPQFSIVCHTNHLFDIKTTDHGTWRRIRVVNFMSTFTDKTPILDREKEIFEFKKDRKIKEKLMNCKELFMALLIQKACETKGVVTDCDIVLSASNTYREKQDYFAKFIREKIIKGSEEDRITKTNMIAEFDAWYESETKLKAPKFQELEDYLNKPLGKMEKKNNVKAWWGYKLVYNSYSSEGDESDEDE